VQQVRHGQGDLLPDLGGAQLQPQVAHLRLQGRRPPARVARRPRRPARRARLQRLKGGLQGPVAQGVEAPLADAQRLRGRGGRPAAGQHLQEHGQPGLGRGRPLQARRQPRPLRSASPRHRAPLLKNGKPEKATAALPGVL
jgi:hypothetical protein